MKIEQEFVVQFFCLLCRGQRVGEVVRQPRPDGLDKNPEANPIIPVILKNLQTRESVGSILENSSAVFGLFQKRQIRSESKVRREGVMRGAQQAEGDRCEFEGMIHGLKIVGAKAGSLEAVKSCVAAEPELRQAESIAHWMRIRSSELRVVESLAQNLCLVTPSYSRGGASSNPHCEQLSGFGAP